MDMDERAMIEVENQTQPSDASPRAAPFDDEQQRRRCLRGEGDDQNDDEGEDGGGGDVISPDEEGIAAATLRAKDGVSKAYAGASTRTAYAHIASVSV